MIDLILRIFKKRYLVQGALVLLIASAVVVLLIYGAYIDREGRALNARMKSRIPEGCFLAHTAPTLDLTTNSVRYYVSLLAAWREGITASSIGDLPCVFLTTDPGLNALAPPGTALVPRSIAGRFRLSAGDSLALLDGGKAIQTVVEVYESSVQGLPYGFGERVVVVTGQQESNTHFLYRHVSSTVEAAKNDIRRLHPGSIIEDYGTDQAAGASLVRNNYAGLMQAQISLAVFLAVAFLTAKVLSFLDGRRTMAILKATGLGNNQVGAVMAAEALLAPLLGITTGLCLGQQLLEALARRGTGMSVTLGNAITAVAFTLPALAIGVIVPSRFAQIATAVELLLERKIPLCYERIKTTARRFPQLDAYVARGVQFVKLEMAGGEFEGVIFRQLGDTVKQGEVLAHATSWWGLKITEYIAPVDGTVVYFQPDTGFIGMAAAEMLAPSCTG